MNKSLISFVAFIFFQHFTAHSQAVIKAGTVQLSGGVGYLHGSTDSPYTVYTGSGYTTTTQYVKGSSFSVSPSIGYFVADNFAIGLNGGYNQATTSYSYSNSSAVGNEQKNSQYIIGGFAQYYKMFTEQFGIVGTLGAGYAHGKAETTSPSSNANTSEGFTTSITPSIVFFPVPRFALGASIGNLSYVHTKNTTPTANTGSYPINATDTYTNSSFGANFGLSQLTFSGSYFFGR